MQPAARGGGRNCNTVVSCLQVRRDVATGVEYVAATNVVERRLLKSTMTLEEQAAFDDAYPEPARGPAGVEAAGAAEAQCPVVRPEAAVQGHGGAQ